MKASSVLPLFAALLLALIATAAHAATYFVATGGDDAQPGTLTSPLRTIQRAAELAQPGDTIIIRGGIYRETVTPARSGTRDARITFMNFPGETVTLNGAELVTGWSRSGDLFCAPLAAESQRSPYNQAPQVFVDGEMMIAARWPNTSLDVSRPSKAQLATFISKSRDPSTNWTHAKFSDPQLASVPPLTGAKIYLQPNLNAWSWTFSGEVVAHEGEVLTLRSRNDSGVDGNSARYAVGSRYFVYGLRSLLDAPGEWFHDEAAGRLYLRTPDDGDPSGKTVEVKRRDFAFDLSERSYITIRGLSLFACTITTDRDAGGDNRGHDAEGKVRYPWRPARSIAPSTGIVLEEIDVRYLSHFEDVSGHFFLQWGQSTGIVLSGSDHTIRDSTLRFSAGNGITLLGQRHLVTNNIITDVNYLSVDCAGISTGGAATTEDHVIAYNTIRATGRSGITIRSLRNSRPDKLVTRIHHNDVGDCMLQDSDGGGIYVAVTDAQFVRIDHNFFHNMPSYNSAGVYPDYAKNYLIDHNVIWNVDMGIHPQGHVEGVNNTLIYHNTIAVRGLPHTGFGPVGFSNSSGTNRGTFIRNNLILCLNPEESPRYALMRPSGFTDAVMESNLMWDSVPGSTTDPKLADVANFDFRLTEDSPARDAGMIIPTETLDGTSIPGDHEFRIGRPDIGAYEYGQPAWRAGATRTRR